MAVISPFRALRPVAEKAAQVASPPYDVVNTEEARTLAANNPYSFLHVSRPEIDLPAGTNIYSDEVYAKASENFQRLIKACPLETEEMPALYLYRQVMGEHTQTGVVACCSVDEYDTNLILKHEKTRPDKEDDRTRHILTTRAQSGPVFSTYRGREEIDNLVNEATKTEPLYDFNADDGIRHTVWIAPDAASLARAFRDVEFLYIADGHHRAASASRARAELKAKNPNHTGDEEYNRFLSVLFPSDQLRILPYNRIVRDLNNLSPEEFLGKVKEKFTLTEGAQPVPESRGQWSMYMNGRWYNLTLKDDARTTNDPVASLDVSILQDNLLDPILGIKDVRTDKRIDFVGGIRGADELTRLVDGKQAAVAFSLYPTTLDDLLRVSDAGSVMPPKSTWFEPKLRDGLLIHSI
ncbi:MAG: DUF1015 domain-containing protein [Pyrinomonadaceae bacterium]